MEKPGSAAISCVVVALRSLSLVACTVVCGDACGILFVSYLLNAFVVASIVAAVEVIQLQETALLHKPQTTQPLGKTFSLREVYIAPEISIA